MHVFVVPDLEGPVTGGTLFNRRVVASLQAQQADCVVSSKATADEQLSRVGPEDVFWIDSLFLDLLPELARAPRRRAPLGLLVHYLPSLVTRGESVSRSELTLAEREALASADLIMVPSRYMAMVVQRLMGALAPILVIEPGRLAVGAAKPPGAPPCAVMVANLLPGKGVLPFLEQLAAQVRSGDEYQLNIVGGFALDPQYAGECRRAAEDSRLQERVRMLGECSPEATLAHMSCCNLFVSASTMESYGMALGEARGLGLPILAVRGGNVELLVDAGAGGEVVSDVTALVEAFVAVCRAPVELRRRLDAAQANVLAPRPWAQVAGEYLDKMEAVRAARQAEQTCRSRDVEPA